MSAKACGKHLRILLTAQLGEKRLKTDVSKDSVICSPSSRMYIA